MMFVFFELTGFSRSSVDHGTLIVARENDAVSSCFAISWFMRRSCSGHALTTLQFVLQNPDRFHVRDQPGILRLVFFVLIET